ncbi:MAG TPA: OsmC family protein [Gemmatimonadaceae bacterium]
MTFTFPGGARVDGRVGHFVIPTDQPPEASAPSPFTLFLASIGACAGFYVQSFCARRAIPTAGIRVVQRNHVAPDGMVDRIDIDVELPPEFPEHYRDAVVRAADQCTVKKHLLHPPVTSVRAVTRQPKEMVAV